MSRPFKRRIAIDSGIFPLYQNNEGKEKLTIGLARSRSARIKAGFGAKVMSRQTTLVHLIYLRPDGMLLSKRRYTGWREIQDEYADYMTSLGPFSEEGLIDFLSEEYGREDTRWGFTREEVRAFMESDATVLEGRRGDGFEGR